MQKPKSFQKSVHATFGAKLLTRSLPSVTPPEQTGRTTWSSSSYHVPCNVHAMTHSFCFHISRSKPSTAMYPDVYTDMVRKLYLDLPMYVFFCLFSQKCFCQQFLSPGMFTHVQPFLAFCQFCPNNDVEMPLATSCILCALFQALGSTG